jgi:hypothetical protein
MIFMLELLFWYVYEVAKFFTKKRGFELRTFKKLPIKNNRETL